MPKKERGPLCRDPKNKASMRTLERESIQLNGSLSRITYETLLTEPRSLPPHLDMRTGVAFSVCFTMPER